jgi:hypothetical protein
MTNDIFKLNAIVDGVGANLSKLDNLGQGGFDVPLVTTPDELGEMIGQQLGSWRPLSDDLLWFCNLKLAIYAREILAQSARIFRQLDDEEFAERVERVIEVVDEQFHPADTALEVCHKLLGLDRYGAGPLNGQ